VQEERNPLFDVSVVSGRTAPELVSAVDVPDELSVAERGDDMDVAGAVNAAGVCFHNRLFPRATTGRGNRNLLL